MGIDRKEIFQASKDAIQVVEQVQSSFDFLSLNEDEKKDLECVNIMKKPIKHPIGQRNPRKFKKLYKFKRLKKPN